VAEKEKLHAELRKVIGDFLESWENFADLNRPMGDGASSPHVDGPQVIEATQRALERADYPPGEKT
jgi:hypothetical protein